MNYNDFLMNSEPEEAEEVSNNLTSYVINKVELNEMLMHMKDCDDLDDDPSYNSSHSLNDGVSIFWGDLYSLSYGIVPGMKEMKEKMICELNKLEFQFTGTKWCGKGNIAESYHDLGEFRDLDR